jgi:hypothetical protein
MLLFRPGGHGALLENLQSLNAPFVFIKNIDNVTTAQRNSPTVLWSRLLLGLLVKTQRKTFDLLRRLESDPAMPRCTRRSSSPPPRSAASPTPASWRPPLRAPARWR